MKNTQWIINIYIWIYDREGTWMNTDSGLQIEVKLAKYMQQNEKLHYGGSLLEKFVSVRNLIISENYLTFTYYKLKLEVY